MLFDRLFRRHGDDTPHPRRAVLGPVVHGGTHGIVTSLAIVAGFAGAAASADGAAGFGTGAVITLGLATLCATALWTGLGAVLSGQSRRAFHAAGRRRLMARMEADPRGARQALEELLARGGYDEGAARDAAGILIRNPGFVADLVLARDPGMRGAEAVRPALDGASRFLACVLLGLLPLLPYLLAAPEDIAFALAATASAPALLLLGVLHRHATGAGVPRALAGTVLLGGLCAGVAYAVGRVVAGGGAPV